MNKQDDDRRKRPRKLISLQAEIIGSALGKVTVYTQDLSAGGAFVLMPRDKCLPIGSAVTIRIYGALPGEEASTFGARVTRITDQGMGLEFYDFDFT
ncbi:MAG: PilZ domain-containing protein [Pseudomonadota bacterium]